MGGYPPKHSGQDIHFEVAAKRVRIIDNKLYTLGDLPKAELRSAVRARQCYDIPDEDLYYLYRFGGTGSYHLCVWGPNKGYDESMRWVNKRIAPGTYIIKPHWKLDYVKLVQDNIDRYKDEQANGK